MFKSNKVKAVICIFIFFVVSLFTYQYVLTTNLQKETITKIGEISSQNVKLIKHEIEDTFNLMSETKMQIMDHYYKDGKFDQKAIVNNFKSIVDRQAFFRMGIVLNDGSAFTTRNIDFSIADRSYIQEAIQGNRYVSDVFIDRQNQMKSVVLSMPLDYNGEILGAIFIGYNIEQFREQMSVYSFQDEGYSYIIRSNGDAVMDSVHEGSFENFTNLYLSLENASSTNESVIKELRKELGKEDTGSFVFRNKIDKYCYFASLGIKDWYLLTVVPTHIIDDTSNFVLGMTAIFFIVLFILFSWLMGLILSFLKGKNKELEKIIYVDKITQRASYERFLKDAHTCFKRVMENEKVAFLYIDLDNFKLINDLYGFEAGNQIIRLTSDSIQKNIHTRDIFARISADQFVVLFIYHQQEDLYHFVRSFQNNLNKDNRLFEDYDIGTNIGIYEISDYAESIEFMQNCAKIAHATIKGKSDLDIAFYSDEMRLSILHRKMIENSISQGLQQNEFVTYYQPKVDTFTQTVVGSEALIRWISKNGVVSPGYFIDVAEETGQIIALDECVFTKVCQNIRYLLDHNKKVVPVSINVSKKTMYQPKFIEKYKAIIEAYQVPPVYIQLEITESMLYVDIRRTNQMIKELHDMGIKVLMDDFGTGYSSIMMLKDIAIDILKLDKSFIDGYMDSKGQEILIATLKLAHALNMNTIAEGVETQEQYEYLKELNCEVIQGYYFFKPLSEEDYMKLLEK